MVTAELAVAMPAVVVLLVVALAALSLAIDQVRCVDAARAAARSAARGDDGATAEATSAAAAPVGATVTVRLASGQALVTVQAARPSWMRWLGLDGLTTATAAADLEETSAGVGVPP